MSDLKPCPFCGGEAIAKLSSAKWVDEAYRGKIFVVGCKECSCTTSPYLALNIIDRCEAKRQAIAAWNRRAE